MRPEDNVYRMPAFPSLGAPQEKINAEMVDSVKAVWIQLKRLRDEVKSLEIQVNGR
jgi:hypothetical protein